MRLLTLTMVFALIPEIFAQNAAAPRRDAYWADKETGLVWAAADNAFGVSWTQASNYCRALTLGGHKDWTLPAIDELQGLFGGATGQNGHHVRGPIAITGWAWSSSPGREPGEQWALDFGDGGRASVAMGDSGLNRALCVRRAISGQ
jgi:formylglycine-generating enzyme required for sulfatase activity